MLQTDPFDNLARHQASKQQWTRTLDQAGDDLPRHMGRVIDP